jgi:hypothetical protein
MWRSALYCLSRSQFSKLLGFSLHAPAKLLGFSLHAPAKLLGFYMLPPSCLATCSRLVAWLHAPAKLLGFSLHASTKLLRLLHSAADSILCVCPTPTPQT